MSVFAEKMKFVQEHNSRNSDDHTVELNQFADATEMEYKKLLGYKPVNRERNANYYVPLEAAPASVDWRTKGAVTPVKNQGQCGSCWSFSATGSMEGAHAISTGKLVSLSEQQLMDCSTSFGNNSCNGGLMDYAFKYAEGVAMDTEESYPYTAKDGKCHNETGTASFEVKSFQDVTVNDPQALMEAVALGPVSIAVDAASLGWQLYHGGILKHFCGTSLDHGVLLVGYGTEGKNDFWIVKNSWGAGWGEKGYLRILRQMDKKGPGVCGLQQSASYPIV